MQRDGSQESWKPLPKRTRKKRPVNENPGNGQEKGNITQQREEDNASLGSIKDDLSVNKPQPAFFFHCKDSKEVDHFEASEPTNATVFAARVRAVDEQVSLRSRMIRATQLDGHDDTKSIGNFEYLDHTADVQLHAWGSSIEKAFEQMALSMFHYMSDVRSVRVDPTMTTETTVTGHDKRSLLYRFLDELLFQFSAEEYLCCFVSVDQLKEGKDSTWSLRMRLEGEKMDLSRHPQGTEVKAITFSNMQVHEEENQVDLFVIIDI